MFKVKVNREELLLVLKKNKVQHQKDFLEAIEGYKKFAIDSFQEWLEKAKTGNLKKIKTYFQFDVPKSHKEDYDRIISMLSMSIDKTIELEEERFEQYVQDKWTWKDQFIVSNSLYTK